jgi:ferritin-like metal-binding protein YciE
MPRNTGTTASKKKTAASKKTSKTTSMGSRRQSNTNMKSDMTMLKELFIDELKDIYWAEKHLTKALPKMMKAASNEELKNAFDEHLAVTENQIGRVEEVFDMLDIPAKAKKCEAMEGLVRESQNLMDELPKGTSARDAGLIISGQKIEHYEIAAYGSLVQLAKTMGENDIAELLQETLDEEKNADELLTELAVSSININAENEEEE